MALAAIAGLAVAVPVLSDSGWRETSGYRLSGSDRTEFELRTRGLEALLIERRDGGIVFTASCHGRRLEETYGDPPYTIVRDADGAEQCFRWATGSLLGYGQLRDLAESARAVSSPRPGLELSGFPPGSEWRQVVLEVDSSLPIRAVSGAGAVVEWYYDATGEPVRDSAATPASSTKPDEVYESIARADARARIGLSSRGVMPESIGDLKFETAFSYLGGQLTSSRIYVIWTGANDRQIQLIVSPGLLPPDTPTVEDLGGGATMLNVQEADAHWQIMASDGDLLRAAVLALRPEYASKLN